MITLILSILAGALSVLAPCILPLLPIIIGGSIQSDGSSSSKRPYIIISSLVVSLVAFTLLLRASTSLLGIDPRVWQYGSGGIVIILGVFMLLPDMWDRVIGALGIQAKSQQLLGKAGQKKNQNVSAVLTGAALGPVFSSCSPMYAWIVATVIPDSSALGIVYLIGYVFGLAVALLAISRFGQRLIEKIKWASDPHSTFTKVVAILFILVGIAVATGLDKDIQTYLVEQDFINIKALENRLVPDEL